MEDEKKKDAVEEEEFIFKLDSKESPDSQNLGLIDYFVSAREIKASDIYFSVDECPTIKVHGRMHKLLEHPFYRADELKDLIYAILTPEQIETFEKELDLEVIFIDDRTSTVRITLYHSQEGIGASCRMVPFTIPTFKDLGPAESIERIASLDDGLVLVTGEASSGKSTTIASILEWINTNEKKYILTIEDILEFRHYNQSSLIDQRIVGIHTKDFRTAIHSAVRSNADVIFLSDILDAETFMFALNAAESGRLVFASFRVFGSTAEALYKIINLFPESQHDYIRNQIARVLRSVIWQHLVPLKDHEGLIPAMEILMNTKKISQLIRKNELDKISIEIKKGGVFGMQTMEQSLHLIEKASIIEHSVSFALKYGKFLLALV